MIFQDVYGLTSVVLVNLFKIINGNIHKEILNINIRQTIKSYLGCNVSFKVSKLYDSPDWRNKQPSVCTPSQ